MDTFPYEDWDDALANADGVQGYFTFGPGGNTALVILTILAILLAFWWLVNLTMSEDKHLNEAAAKLNEKWGI